MTQPIVNCDKLSHKIHLILMIPTVVHCTMPASTCHPQQAINHIPSVNEPHITATLTIPDAVASHIIGHAGMGLCQIHDFSHMKVAMSSHVGPLASCAITIWGSPHEVGDAIITLGH